LLFGALSFTAWQVGVAELRREARKAFWTGRIEEASQRYELLERWDPLSSRGIQGQRDVYTRVIESPETLGPALGVDSREAGKRCAQQVGQLVTRAPLDPDTWSGVADFFGALKPQNQRQRAYSLQDISVRPEENVEPEDILQIRALELARRVDSNGVFFADSLGDVAWNLGLRSLALSSYEDSVLLMPDADQHPFLDALTLDPELLETTIRAFHKSLDKPRSANPADVYRNLGFFLMSLGRSSQAREAFRGAEQAATSGNNYISLQAYAAASDGKTEEAIQLYRRSLARDLLDPEERFRNLVFLGELLERTGQHEQAVLQLRNALMIKPRESRALATLGSVYEAMGLIEEAGEQYERAAESSEDRIAPLVGLVDFYRRVGLPAQALDPARKLVKLQPGEAVYRKQLEQIQDEILQDFGP